MSNEIGVEISLFVQHGREQEAADFYCAAFGAEPLDFYRLDGVLMSVALCLGNILLTVAGSNPKREQQPAYGGPFFPKAAGAVSAIFRLNVGDLDHVVQQAANAGAVIRDPAQQDQTGRRIASLFDPFGHIWALAERSADDVRRAA